MSSSGVFGDEEQNPFFETVKTQTVSNSLTPILKNNLPLPTHPHNTLVTHPLSHTAD